MLFWVATVSSVYYESAGLTVLLYQMNIPLFPDSALGILAVTLKMFGIFVSNEQLCC